jgi:hypothetical protein
MRSSSGISTRCEWKAYLGLLETESLLLLFLSRRDGQILPKRAFASEADLKAARSLIEDNIGLLNPAPFPAGPPAP